ncbi:TPA: hypothetical protein N0F65_010665, partial [Lagenidium giganteum]
VAPAAPGLGTKSYPPICIGISLAQIYARMGVMSYRGAVILFGCSITMDVKAIVEEESVNIKLTSLIIYCVFVIAITQARGHIRNRFGIPGNSGEDSRYAAMCSMCIIAQMATHIKSYRPGWCSFGPKDALRAYNDAHRRPVTDVPGIYVWRSQFPQCEMPTPVLSRDKSRDLALPPILSKNPFVLLLVLFPCPFGLRRSDARSSEDVESTALHDEERWTYDEIHYLQYARKPTRKSYRTQPVKPNDEGRQQTADDIVTGRWEEDICGQCNHCIPNCLMSCFCVGVSLAQIYRRMGIMRYNGALVLFGGLTLAQYVSLTIGLGIIPTHAATHAITWAAQIIFVAIQMMFVLATMEARSRIRNRFNIPRYWCWDDGWCACFCMATHIKSYKKGSCSFGSQDVLPAYSGGAGMN